MASKHYDLDTDILLGDENTSDIYIASQKAVKTYVDNKTVVENTYDAESNIAISGTGVSEALETVTRVTFRVWED